MTNYGCRCALADQCGSCHRGCDVAQQWFGPWREGGLGQESCQTVLRCSSRAMKLGSVWNPVIRIFLSVWQVTVGDRCLRSSKMETTTQKYERLAPMDLISSCTVDTNWHLLLSQIVPGTAHVKMNLGEFSHHGFPPLNPSPLASTQPGPSKKRN